MKVFEHLVGYRLEAVAWRNEAWQRQHVHSAQSLNIAGPYQWLSAVYFLYKHTHLLIYLNSHLFSTCWMICITRILILNYCLFWTTFLRIIICELYLLNRCHVISAVNTLYATKWLGLLEIMKDPPVSIA